MDRRQRGDHDERIQRHHEVGHRGNGDGVLLPRAPAELASEAMSAAHAPRSLSRDSGRDAGRTRRARRRRRARGTGSRRRCRGRPPGREPRSASTRRARCESLSQFPTAGPGADRPSHVDQGPAHAVEPGQPFRSRLGGARRSPSGCGRRRRRSAMAAPLPSGRPAVRRGTSPDPCRSCRHRGSREVGARATAHFRPRRCPYRWRHAAR